jgi:hypothetical protein
LGPAAVIFTGDVLKDILDNPSYLGKVKIDGQLIEAKHPALIDEVTWTSCLEVRRRNRRNRYSGAGATSVSWYQPEPAVSLALIDLLGVAKGAPVIDIGGGASLLLDRLLARGYKDLTVLDVSSTALEMARRRLDDAVPVRWLADPLLARREVDDQRAEANRVVIAHRAPELAEHLD